MKTNSLLVCFFLFYTLLTTDAQNFNVDNYSLINTNVDDFYTDYYGNSYTVQNFTLTKYNPEGLKIASFSQQEWGPIFSITANNHLKIMIFYKETGIILFLDENLVPISNPFYLFDNQYYNISLAGFSSANEIHLFDVVNQELITLDFNLQKKTKTSLSFPDFNPFQMIELENQSLALHDSISGIYIFDAFGNFDKIIPIISPNNITIVNNTISYFDQNVYKKYNFATFENSEQPIDISNICIKSIQIFQNRIYALDKKGNFFLIK